MHFESPDWLVLLALIPLLVIAYVWAQRRRSRYALRYSSVGLVKEALAKSPGWRRHIPPLFFLIGTTAMIVALARPMGALSILKQQATVILTIDVSGSMRATDIKPNRLEAAKAAARAFIAQQDRSTRIGIVSFSAGAFIVQAPTTDREAALAAIDRLRTQARTAIGSGILVSLDAIFEEPNKSPAPSMDAPLAAPTPTATPVPSGTHIPATIVLLTDGQSNTGPLPVDAAHQAADRGVRVFTIGVGTSQGQVLGDPFGGGFGGFRATLDDKTLKQVAEMTGGEYFHASDENALVSIYNQLSTELVASTEQTEVSVVFTALAAFFVLGGGLLSLMWFSRLP